MAPVDLLAGVVWGASLLLAGVTIEQAVRQLLFAPAALPELDLAPYRLADPTPDDADWCVYAAPRAVTFAYDPLALVRD